MSDYIFVTERDGGELYMEMNRAGSIFFHFECSHFSKSSWKAWHLEWLDILDELEEAGIYEVFAFLEHDKPKQHKLILSFGFTPLIDTGTGLIYRRFTHYG